MGRQEGVRGEKRAGSMASEEPACQGGTWYPLKQEVCYGGMLLGWEMGMGKQHGEQDS